MSNLYTNLPPQQSNNSDNSTVQAFNSYVNRPLELNASTLDAMKSFFTARGFNETSSESISVVLIAQAKKDNYNPLQILDTLKGLTNVEISTLVGEIINYTRFKTSFLGYTGEFKPNAAVNRNVLL
jgi:SUMO ligase MMS21 Smc5/6 complex component